MSLYQTENYSVALDSLSTRVQISFNEEFIKILQNDESEWANLLIDLHEKLVDHGFEPDEYPFDPFHLLNNSWANQGWIYCGVHSYPIEKMEKINDYKYQFGTFIIEREYDAELGRFGSPYTNWWIKKNGKILKEDDPRFVLLFQTVDEAVKYIKDDL